MNTHALSFGTKKIGLLFGALALVSAPIISGCSSAATADDGSDESTGALATDTPDAAGAAADPLDESRCPAAPLADADLGKLFVDGKATRTIATGLKWDALKRDSNGISNGPWKLDGASDFDSIWLSDSVTVYATLRRDHQVYLHLLTGGSFVQTYDDGLIRLDPASHLGAAVENCVVDATGHFQCHDVEKYQAGSARLFGTTLGGTLNASKGCVRFAASRKYGNEEHAVVLFAKF